MANETVEVRERWEALRAMQRLLKEENHERDQILKAVERPSLDEVDQEKLVASFRDLVERRPPGTASQSSGVALSGRIRCGRPWWNQSWVAVAAAAVLVVLLWIPWGNVFRAEQFSGSLGSDDLVPIVILSPTGEVDEYQLFQFEAPDGVPVTSYQVTVFEIGLDGRERRPLQSRLTPSRDVVIDGLEYSRIRWIVVGYDIHRNEVARGESEAFLAE